jgi:transposase
VDAHGMPVRIIITEGTKHDSTQASFLIEGISAEHLLADKAYESDAILLQLNQQGISPVIPPKSNRREPWPFDKDLYKLRHLIENAFLHLKRWRGIATRYAKNAASFMAAVQIRCIALWGGLI